MLGISNDLTTCSMYHKRARLVAVTFDTFIYPILNGTLAFSNRIAVQCLTLFCEMLFVSHSPVRYAPLLCFIFSVTAADISKDISAILPLKAAAYGTSYDAYLLIGMKHTQSLPTPGALISGFLNLTGSATLGALQLTGPRCLKQSV